MSPETQIKLGGLKGHLCGMRLVAQSQIRMAHKLGNDWKGTAIGVAYRDSLSSLVANLQNIRQAERELEQITKELEENG